MLPYSHIKTRNQRLISCIHPHDNNSNKSPGPVAKARLSGLGGIWEALKFSLMVFIEVPIHKYLFKGPRNYNPAELHFTATVLHLDFSLHVQDFGFRACEGYGG